MVTPVLLSANQILSKVLNTLENALRVELGEGALPDINEKLNEIISLMGGSDAETLVIDHDLAAAAFEDNLGATQKWFPKALMLLFSTDEERTVEIFLKDKTSDVEYLIYSFTKDLPMKKALNIWFTEFNIQPFLENTMDLLVKISQTSGACHVNGLIIYDELEPTGGE
jgi:hypothetical protein